MPKFYSQRWLFWKSPYFSETAAHRAKNKLNFDHPLSRPEYPFLRKDHNQNAEQKTTDLNFQKATRTLWYGAWRRPLVSQEAISLMHSITAFMFCTFTKNKNTQYVYYISYNTYYQPSNYSYTYSHFHIAIICQLCSTSAVIGAHYFPTLLLNGYCFLLWLKYLQVFGAMRSI